MDGDEQQTSGMQAADQMQQSVAQAPPPAQAAPQTQQPAPQQQGQQGGAQSEQEAAAQMPAQPTVIQPVKRGGLAGILDEFRDAVAGTTSQSVATDDQGNKYIQTHDLSNGSRWMRVAGTAIRGAAAGLANGRGAGNGGKAFEAGIQAGDQVQQQRQEKAQQQNAEVRQATLDKFNFVKLQHDIAAQTFEAQRRKIEATQHDVAYAQMQDQRQKDMGSSDLGIYDFHTLPEVQAAHPEFWKDTHGGKVQGVPVVGPDGKFEGLHVWLQLPDVGSQLAPKDSTLMVFKPPMKPGEHGSMVPQTISIPMTNNSLDARNAAQYNAFRESEKAIADAADKTSQEKLRDAQTKTQTSERARNYAEANAANARAAATKTGAENPDGTPNPKFEGLAQALYDGDLLPKDLKREAKGQGLDPNALMARAREIGQANGKPWSETIIEQEHKFAENPKVQAALDGIDRIIGKPGEQGAGYMGQMLNLAGKANLSTNGAFNAASLAVMRAFGGDSAKNFETAVSETRRSIAGLIGNPVLGGSDSDKKLQQADEMLGQKPTMKNLTDAAGILKAALETQRQSMTQNNRYLQRRYSGTTQQTQQPAPQQQQATPPAIPAGTAPPPAGTKRIWAPGSPTWRDVPEAQVPKNVPGLVMQ